MNLITGVMRLVLKLSFITVRKTSSVSRLPILIFHRVLDERDPFYPMEPDTKEFELQMSVIGRYFQTFTMSEAVDKLEDNSLPGNALCITFDDGYKDNIVNAYEVLSRYNLKATFFIATGYIEKGMMWNDRILSAFRKTKNSSISIKELGFENEKLTDVDTRVHLARLLLKKVKYRGYEERERLTGAILKSLNIEINTNIMMSDDDIISLQNTGMEIGGHTENHPILADENDNKVYEELSQGKKYLENILNRRISSFAYPNGRLGMDYTDKTKKVVKRAGFSSAVTTNGGVSTRNDDVYELKRLSLAWTSELIYSLRLLRNIYLF